MTGFILSMIVGWFFYARSKYYSGAASELTRKTPPWLVVIPLSLISWVYYRQWDWAVAILLVFTAVPLAYAMVVFLTNINRRYAWFFVGLLVVLFILDLIY